LPLHAVVYRRSLLKAYQRTLEEGRFKFVILDAPNIAAADFKDFWVAGQAAGYEVFVAEMPESDPQVRLYLGDAVFGFG
jgi:YLP motif-containing protein 1